MSEISSFSKSNIGRYWKKNIPINHIKALFFVRELLGSYELNEEDWKRHQNKFDYRFYQAHTKRDTHRISHEEIEESFELSKDEKEEVDGNFLFRFTNSIECFHRIESG